MSGGRRLSPPPRRRQGAASSANYTRLGPGRTRPRFERLLGKGSRSRSSTQRSTFLPGSFDRSSSSTSSSPLAVQEAASASIMSIPNGRIHLGPPQVVILEFLDTFSSSSRRWRHQFLLSVSLLLPDFRRAGCVAARTGVGVTCPSARRALFCVDSAVYLVKLLSRQAHTGLIHTLGCRGQATRPRQALYVHTVERPAPLTRRHTTLTPGSIADCSTRIFRQVQAPIRQRDCSAHPPRRPPCTLLCARWTSECTKLRRATTRTRRGALWARSA